MKKLEKALEVLKNYKIPNDITLWDKPLTNTHLQDNFTYCIKTEELSINKKEIPVLGASLTLGAPQLPENFEWPKDYYFLCQLNLNDLTNADLHELFPKEGMLYIFLDPSCFEDENFSKTGAKVYYYSGANEALELKDFPAKDSFNEDNKYYYNKFKESNKITAFRPCFGFNYLKGLNKDLPSKLIQDIEATTGATYDNDNNPTGNIYGEGLFYQGEEMWHFFAPEDWDFGMEIYDCGDKILMFQTYLGDAAIHFWIERENLKNADFSEVFATYSGT